MAALPFATPSAAEPDPAHRVGPLRVVEVDLSRFCDDNRYISFYIHAIFHGSTFLDVRYLSTLNTQYIRHGFSNPPHLLFRVLRLPREVKARLALPFHSDVLFRHDRCNQLRGGDVETRVVYPTFGLSDRAGRNEHLGLDFVTRSVVGGGVEGTADKTGFKGRSVFDRDAVYRELGWLAERHPVGLTLIRQQRRDRRYSWVRRR